mgnify:CR=1 FL=1
MLNEEIFDCVIMDCQIPVMDRYETTKKIKKVKDLVTSDEIQTRIPYLIELE